MVTKIRLDLFEKCVFFLMLGACMSLSYMIGEYHNDVYIIDATQSMISCFELDLKMNNEKIVINPVDDKSMW